MSYVFQCHEHTSVYTVLKLSIFVRDEERSYGVVEQIRYI